MNGQRLLSFVLLFTLLTAGLWATPAGAVSAEANPQKVSPQRAAAAGPALVEAAVPRASGISADWWAQVQEDVRRSEYSVTWQDSTYLPDLASAYQAPNRAQGFRTYFIPNGIRVIPRVLPSGAGGDEGWQLGLFLPGDGDGGAVQVSANRIEYRRVGITAWYLNGEEGLTMGLVFEEPGINDRGPRTEVSSSLTVSLESLLLANLTPRLAADGSSVGFYAADGHEVLRYGDLRARDAAGNDWAIRASLRTPQRLQIELPAVAAYPLTITARLFSPAGTSAPDGLSSTPRWTAESDLAGAQFGYTVRTAGDVNCDGYSDVIVGAPYYDNGQTDEGRAYVYQGSLAGLSLTPNWIAESNQDWAQFGAAAATAGDVNGDGCADVIVGAPVYNGGLIGEGRAYAYYGSPDGLPDTANWTIEGDQANAQLGAAVGMAGDVDGNGYDDVIVGVPFYDNDQENEGGAFVYYGSADGLGGTPSWAAEGGQVSAHFGAAVWTAGDINSDTFSDVIVGAPQNDGGQIDEGRAYVYHGSASGLSATANWNAEINQTNAQFGTAVGTAGDTNGDGYADVIVGAPYYTSGQTGEGRAFLFRGSRTGLSSAPTWNAEINQIEAHFGCSVGTAGDVNGDGYADVIVGAYSYDGDGTITDAGAAYVFHGSATSLGANPNWSISGVQANAFLGWSVGVAGDVNGDGFSDVIIGAPQYDNPEIDEGQAAVYYGAAAGLPAAANWTCERDQINSGLGTSVASAGDLNGDGYADAIVGAPYFDGGQVDEGRAFVYHGSSTGLSIGPSWTGGSGIQGGSYYGSAVGTAGDVNGDGYSDVLIGASRFDNGQTNEGRAFVYSGSASGLGANPAWTAESNQSEALFGSALGTAGDVNGDGYADVVVGAAYYDGGLTDTGRVYIYYGSIAGLSPAPNWIAGEDQANALFGADVGTAGDVNGDGFSDIIVGAPGSGHGEVEEGQAFVYYGSATSPSAMPNWTGEGNQAGAQFGFSAGTAGDVNGDGYADIVVGAPGYAITGTPALTDTGQVYIFQGAAAGLGASPAWTFVGDQGGARLGHAVGLAGDINNDGYADVVVGAPRYDNGEADEGRALLFRGSPQGLSLLPDWIVESNQTGAEFGSAVASAGDVNGDGYADVIVGAPRYDSGQVDEGKSFVYLGNGGAVLIVRPRQLRTSGLVPIAPLGMSDLTAIQFRLNTRMPLGRDQVKLQWQVASLVTPYTSTNIISGTSPSWTDVLTTGVVITRNVAGLAPGTPYHWRVRVLYHPGNALGQPAGRWVHMPWNAWTETDLRTADGPITGLAASNDSPTALGRATTLTATSDLVYVAYTWAFGDGTFGTGPVVTHTYPAAAVYTAVVTGSNSLGTDTVSTTVIVDEIIAGLSATSSSPTPVGEPTTLTATVTTSGYVDYAWAFGDGTTGSGATVTHLYPGIGVYTAAVTASNSLSMLTTTTSVMVVVVPIAGLHAVNDSPTALGQPTTLTATVTAGSLVSYTWALGDGTTGSGPRQVHTYPGVGIYTAVVTASNSAGWITATTVVTVDRLIAGLVATNDGPTELGRSTTLTATASAGSNIAYAWAFGDGATGSGQQAVHSYAGVGAYRAVVTASNSVGLLTATTVVTVFCGPVRGAAFTWSPNEPTAREVVTFHGTAGGSPPFSFAWSFGDGSHGSGPNPAHSYGTAGDYTVVMTVTNGCGQQVVSRVITAIAGCHPPNNADFTWMPLAPTVGEMVTFYGTSGGTSPFLFYWNFGDGSAPSADPTHAYNAVGNYAVVMTVTNGCGQQIVSQVIAIVPGCNPPTNLKFGWVPITPTIDAAVAFAGSSAGTPPLTFHWSFGDGGVGNDATVVHTYAFTGTYTAAMTVTNGCGLAAMQHTLTVVALPAVWKVYLPVVFKGAGP